MRILSVILLTVVLLGVTIFCIQNFGTVTVTFLGWRLEMPMPALVLAVYLAGALTGWGLLTFLRSTIRHATERKE